MKLTVGIVLRVVHAALVELYKLDTRVRDEFDRMPEGLSYALQTGYQAPQLFVEWRNGKLHRCGNLEKPVCALRLKSTGIAFRLFTGQMGLAQAYAQHAFSMQGEIADVIAGQVEHFKGAANLAGPQIGQIAQNHFISTVIVTSPFPSNCAISSSDLSVTWPSLV